MTFSAHYFNWMDFTIITIVLLSTIISLFRGFLREAVSLVVWIIGALLALKFSDDVQPLLTQWIASPKIRYIAAFIVIFGVVFVIGILINVVLHKLVDKTGLSLTDRALGFFFGFARGVLIVALLLMFVNVGMKKEGSGLAQSRLAPEFKPLVAWLNTFLPQQLKNLSQWVRDNDDNNVIAGGTL